jgi:hemoglobin
MGDSLYDRLGGEAAIMAAVDVLYRRLLADELTRPFFTGLDMAAQTRKQVAFLAWAFGGPDAYKGRPLRASHAELVRERGLTDQHFDAVATHLAATLEELSISRALIDEVLALVGTLRSEVLDR